MLLSGFRFWRFKIKQTETLQTNGEYTDLEVSRPNQLDQNSSHEAIQSLIEYQRRLHAVKSRGRVVIDICCALAFIVQTACSVKLGVFAISQDHKSQFQGVMFTLLVIIINIEYFSLKNILDVATE